MAMLPKQIKSKYPKVVLIGRTNAGKSTLFNRLADNAKAIVSPIPNTTRDQNRALVHWKGFSFELIDTGGLDMSSYDALDRDIKKQVELALSDAAGVVLVVDGKADLMPQDKDSALFLKRTGLPTLVCINKADSLRLREHSFANFAELPFDDLIPCSAKNGTGTAELLDAIFAMIPHVATTIEEINPINVAIVGQPNVGKSTLFNSLIGEQRVIVSPIPHTTRDPHDTLIEYNGQLYNLIDTAGMRRKTKVGTGKDGQLEKLSVQGSKDTIFRADVVIYVIDVQQRVHHQDKALMDYIIMKGRSFMLAVNKWDAIPDKTPNTINEYLKYYGHHYDFSPETPVSFISALEHQRTTDLLDIVKRIYDYQHHWMEQAELDGIVRQILSRGPKESRTGFAAKPKRDLVLEGLHQMDVRPPRFILLTPRPKSVAPAIIHMVEKAIRSRCPYDGVPIYIEVAQHIPKQK
jgi:GTP-binding protein